MALEHAFNDLQQVVGEVAQRVAGLVWAVDAVPETDAAHALLDRYQTAAVDAQARQQQLSAAVAAGSAAVRQPVDYAAARLALIAGQTAYHELSDLLGQLDGAPAARERRQLMADLPAWRPWIAGIYDALDQCWPALNALRQALFLCWQSLSEQPAAAISVQTIGNGAILVEAGRPAAQT